MTQTQSVTGGNSGAPEGKVVSASLVEHVVLHIIYLLINYEQGKNERLMME